MLGFLYADYLVLSNRLGDLKAMVGQFVEVYRRRELRVFAGGSMVMNGGKGSEYEVCLKHVSEFKLLGYVLDEVGTDAVE